MVRPTKVRHKRPPFPQIKLTFRSDPETPRGNSNATLHVTVLDASGKPLTDVQVKVTLIMPAMPAMGMGEMRAASDLAWKGSDYVGTIKVPTAGLLECRSECQPRRATPGQLSRPAECAVRVMRRNHDSPAH